MLKGMITDFQTFLIIAEGDELVAREITESTLKLRYDYLNSF